MGLKFKISEVKKKKGSYCCAYGCSNEPNKKLGGLCFKHYGRKKRELDPVYSRYNGFKGNAKKRGKEFGITLQEFRDFCKRTGYIIQKGKRGQNATIDRRCNAQGYFIWNIQILTLSKNASKGAGFRGSDFDCPF
jgi:hypothetical protein